MFERFAMPRHQGLFQAAMWTVSHDYADYKHMDEIVKSTLSFLEASGKHIKGDTAPLREMGGLPGFKAKLVTWLKDDDQSIRAFAAVFIGIIGDKNLASELADLIARRKPKPGELLVYDRGRAAMALGLLRTQEYKPVLANLLNSENGYDRSGAIFALGMFRATEFAPDIASLLNSENGLFDDDLAAIEFLIETGTAKHHKNELAKVIRSKFKSETAIAAMYALASIDAKEEIPIIAKQLSDKFRRGDAAKALALLGAKRYARQISLLLRDESGRVRASALIALGALEAKEYASQVAKMLDGEESYEAATSLFLMGAEKYYSKAYPLLKEDHLRNSYAIDSQFSPLVENKVSTLRQKLRSNLEACEKKTTIPIDTSQTPSVAI